MTLLLLAACTVSARGQGTMVRETIRSDALKAGKPVEIYLPPGYGQSTERYPAIYFLHGLGGSESSYPFLPALLDSLIAARELRPVIVIKPNGHAPPYAGSMYANSALYGLYEDYIAHDLVDSIDARFRTLPFRAGRVIMGHSMGGYGALKIGMRHSNRFTGAVSHSGFLALEAHEAYLEQLLVESGGRPPYRYRPENGIFSLAAFTAAGAFSPNPRQRSQPVDFPLDAEGRIIPEIYIRWQRQMPDYIARHNPRARRIDIYFDCGTADELGFYPMNLALRDSLQAIGMPFTFESFDGGHSDLLEDRVRVGLAFAEAALDRADELQRRRTPLGEGDAAPLVPVEETFAVTLDQPGTVELSIFNTDGEQVESLVYGPLSVGIHRLRFDPQDLPNGIYIYRVEAGGVHEQRKFLVLR